MTVSEYVALVEAELHVRLGTRYSQLVIKGDDLPPDARRALTRYADQVVEFFHTGIDAPLADVYTDQELHNLGLGKLETGRWTHPLGDEMADRILSGVEPLDAARQKELLRGHAPSKLQPIDLHPLNAAGHFTYSLQRGQRYADLPFDTERE